MWLLIHTGISWQDVSRYLVSDLINQYGSEIKSYIELLTEFRRQLNCFTARTCATWQMGLCCVVARCGLLKQYSNLTVIPGPLNLFSAAYMIYIFLAATKQLYKWYLPSVRLSVCLSVCLSVRLSVCPSVTPFWLCSHHRIIMKFSGVITNDQSKVHAKGQGQRSKVKVTEVTTQLNRFRTVTPVWIHIWWWNDAYSLMLLRRGALLFFKVIRQISRSHGYKNRRIWPRLGVSGL